MRVSVRETPGAQMELVIVCSDRNDPQVQALIQRLKLAEKRVPVKRPDGPGLLPAEKVLYGEFVNRSVFLYTANEVLPTEFSLGELEAMDGCFFRCSKSMVVNVMGIERLKSGIGGRILATLSNGEQILVSRHYASSLRKLLTRH